MFVSCVLIVRLSCRCVALVVVGELLLCVVFACCVCTSYILYIAFNGCLLCCFVDRVLLLVY